MIQNDLMPLPPLEIGDFIPPFAMHDDGGKKREINLFAGRPCILCFLPHLKEDYMAAFSKLYREKMAEIQSYNPWVVLISTLPETQIADFKAKHQIEQGILLDKNSALARAFGVGDGIAKSPLSIILSANQQIVTYCNDPKPENHIQDMIQKLKFISDTARQYKFTLPAFAPIMMVPDALSPQQIEHVIDYWKKGAQYGGTIGDGKEAKVNLSGKRRIDVDVIDRDFLAYMDAVYSKRLFPEIRKVFALDVKYRDRYKIGCYKSDDQGYYNQHRDTSVPSLSHRRVSVSLILNDAYEGGYLEFPEYGPHARFKAPKAGTALCFPSTLLHKVTPVTAGERFIMVSFFHGEAEEKWRKQHIEDQGRIAYNPDEVRLLCEDRYPDLEYSRDFYTRSI